MIALSIRQPWAWLILNAGKDVENRDWPTQYRGRLLIHASKGVTQREYMDAVHFVAIIAPAIIIPPIDLLYRGGIIGSVEITDCVERSSSPWFSGRYGFLLAHPETTPFKPWRGSLGLFKIYD